MHVRELVAYRAYNTGVLMSQFPGDADVPTPGLAFGLVSPPPSFLVRALQDCPR